MIDFGRRGDGGVGAKTQKKKKENPISTNLLIRFLTNSYRIDSYRTNFEDITSVSQSPLILKRYIERALTRNII